jgi:hypothetical protein
LNLLRRVLLHYHIFKNAGTTVEDILAHTFFDRFARFDSADTDHVLSNGELLQFVEGHPNLEAVSSHQIRYPVPAAPGILFFDLCFLREPLERIRSTYEYFREKPVKGNAASEAANNYAIGEFLTEMALHHPWFIQDAQVNILAGRSVDDAPAGAADLEKATRTMMATAFLGVVDRFQESLTAGAHFLRPVFPHFNLEQPAANVSAGKGGSREEGVARMRASTSPEVWDEVLRLNALDRELVSRARSEVRRRFAMAQDCVPSKGRL